MSDIPLELVKTGISGMDQLLSGGFIKGSTVLVSGNYGVGKTLFALEYAFHQARRGEKVLYVSTSEPVFKVRQFASNLEFYDDALVQTGYHEYSVRKNAHHAGSVEFIESSLGIITGLHYNDESSLIEEIRNMVEGKGIQHLVIDPITTITMLYENETVLRKDMLLMGAWLTRLGCTVLLTAEETDPRLLDVEKYLADCVISLSSQMQEHEREFYVTVQKLRGNRQNMSRHLYTLGREGVTVIHDRSMQKAQDTLHHASLGIASLDRIAPVDYGMTWVLSVDDRAHFTPVLESVISSAFSAGDGIVYAPPSRLPFHAIDEGLKRHGADITAECERGNAFLVDHYGRRMPDNLKPYVVQNSPEVEKLVIYSASRPADRRWRIIADLNGERYAHGPEALRHRFTAGQSRARENGDLFFGYCNFRELEPELAAFVRQACDGIIEVYVKGKYQCLRVSKSPGGCLSNEHVLVPSENKPYIKLMQK